MDLLSGWGASGDVDWQPTESDLALWKFFKLSGQPAVAGLCLADHAVAIGILPPDPVLSAGFMAQHAGHTIKIVSNELDGYLERQRTAG